MRSQLKELLILHFLNDSIRATIIVLLPLIAKDLTLSLTQVGFLGSSQPMIGALLALPAGYIMGKFGGYKVIMTLLLIYSLGVVSAAFALNAPMLFLAYLIAALGFGMFHPVGFALTANVSNDSNVGKNLGEFSAMGELGRSIIPPAAFFIAAIIGWRITIGVVGAIGIALFFLSRFYSPQKNVYALNNAERKAENHKDFIKHIFELLRDRKAVFIVSAAIIDSIASSPIYVYLPFLLLAKGYNATMVSIVMGGFFIGSFIGKALLGRFADTLGHKAIFIISELSMAISLLFITFINDYFSAILFATLLGVFTKGTSPVVQTLFSQLTEKAHYHKIFAVSELFITIAAVLSITVLGAVADTSGVAVVFSTSAILGIGATVPILILMHLKTQR